VLPSDWLLSTKPTPAPAPMYGVITEPGMKSYNRLAKMPSWPTWLFTAVPGTPTLVWLLR